MDTFFRILWVLYIFRILWILYIFRILWILYIFRILWILYTFRILWILWTVKSMLMTTRLTHLQTGITWKKHIKIFFFKNNKKWRKIVVLMVISMIKNLCDKINIKNTWCRLFKIYCFFVSNNPKEVNKKHLNLENTTYLLLYLYC